MSNTLQQLRTFLTAIGGALPVKTNINHGQFRIKRAVSTEDELYNVLRDSSGVLQDRRILTKTYADTLYADDPHTHASTLIVQEGGSTVDATVGTINFDASDFNVTESPEDTVAVALAYGTGSGTPAEGNHLHDSTYVNVTGDTMTGELNLDSDGTTIFRTRNAAGTTVYTAFVGPGGTPGLRLANGSDVIIYSGDFLGTVLVIDGATGDIDTEGKLIIGTGGVQIVTGTGDPEGVVSAVVGSLFLRTDGGTGTTLYVKESGSSNTGWSSAA